MNFTYTTDHYGVHHQVPPTITATYDKDYVASRYDKYGIKTKGMSALRAGYILSNIIQLPAGAEVCDVGYGNGAFLTAMMAMGYKGFGIDVSDVPVPTGARRCHHGALTFPWDLLTFFDSLEHMPDISFLENLTAKIVVVTAPYCHWDNPDDPDFLNWKHRRPGEHLHHFNPSSLDRIFIKKYRLVATSSIEDAIRGLLDQQDANNTFTTIYSKR